LEVAREKKKVVQFTGRTESNVQKLFEFASPSSSAPFGNIRGYRVSRAPHLTRKSIAFLLRKGSGCPVDTQGKCVAFLPDQKFSEVLHREPVLGAYHL